jgi:hypothetical protein
MHSSGEEAIEAKVKNEGTGSPSIPSEYKDIIYAFDKYEIKVRLTPDNQFIGIVEVKVNKDFLSYKQKVTSKGFHDVEEFYKE